MFRLHSGGAYGSDYVFGKYAYIINAKINHYYYIDKTPHGNIEISEKDYLEGLEYVKKVSPLLNKYPPKKEYVKHLLARNWIQVKNSNITYAVANIDFSMNIVLGGTGYAVEMSKLLKRKIFVFDLNNNKWFKYNYKLMSFKEYFKTLYIKKYNYVGIGTREITDNGIKAIIKLYKNTKLIFEKKYLTN